MTLSVKYYYCMTLIVHCIDSPLHAWLPVGAVLGVHLLLPHCHELEEVLGPEQQHAQAAPPSNLH